MDHSGLTPSEPLEGPSVTSPRPRGRRIKEPTAAVPDAVAPEMLAPETLAPSTMPGRRALLPHGAPAVAATPASPAPHAEVLPAPPAPPTHLPAAVADVVITHVAPPDVDGVRTVAVGTALWALALLALLPFYGWLADTGRVWWIWTCSAGVGLGLLGLEYCRSRRDRAAEATRVAAGLTSGGRRRR